MVNSTTWVYPKIITLSKKSHTQKEYAVSSVYLQVSHLWFNQLVIEIFWEGKSPESSKEQNLNLPVQSTTLNAFK